MRESSRQTCLEILVSLRASASRNRSRVFLFFALHKSKKHNVFQFHDITHTTTKAKKIS